MTIDYSGFADSTKSFSKKNVNRDIDAAFKYLKDLGAKKVNLIGHSFGSAVALDYYRHSRKEGKEIIPIKVFVFSPWKTLSMIIHTSKVLHVIFSVIPSLEHFLFRDLEYDNMDVIKMLGKEVTIFHGKNDSVITSDHSEMMSKEAPQANLILTNDDHTSVFRSKENWKIVFANAI